MPDHMREGGSSAATQLRLCLCSLFVVSVSSVVVQCSRSVVCTAQSRSVLEYVTVAYRVQTTPLHYGDETEEIRDYDQSQGRHGDGSTLMEPLRRGRGD